MEFITENWIVIWGFITSAVTLFSVVAKVTTNKPANKIAAMLLKIVDIIALNTEPTKHVDKHGNDVL